MARYNAAVNKQNQAWSKKNLDRVNVGLPIGAKAAIQEGAAAAGLSVNAWIARAIDTALKAEGFPGLPTREEVRAKILQERGQQAPAEAPEKAPEEEEEEGRKDYTPQQRRQENGRKSREEEEREHLAQLARARRAERGPDEIQELVARGEIDMAQAREMIIERKKRHKWEEERRAWEDNLRQTWEEMANNHAISWQMVIDAYARNGHEPPDDQHPLPSWEEYLEQGKQRADYPGDEMPQNYKA